MYMKVGVYACLDEGRTREKWVGRSREKGEIHWCIKFVRPSLQYLAVGKREKGKES
jgi:hypothetical protein